MAESYIPVDTNIVCTNMQTAVPGKIVVYRNEPNIIYKGKKKFFLNEDDLKIKETFNCKMATKKWGGLAMLAMGVALGAAIVLTGGAALIVVGAAVAVAAAATRKEIYETHDCDESLSGKWKLNHPTVNFQGKKALLNRSFIECPIGGKVTIIMSNAIAQQAADFISSNNKKEVAAQLSSKYAGGIIGGLTGGASLPGLAIAAGCDVMFEDGENYTYDREKIYGNLKEDALETGIGTGVDVGKEGIAVNNVTRHNQAVTRQVQELNLQAAMRRAAGNVAGAERSAIAGQFAQGAYRGHSFKPFLKGLGTGLAGAAVSFGIDHVSNQYENELQRETRRNEKFFDDADASSNISVIAPKAK